MSERYVVNKDLTLTRLPDDVPTNRPWFASLTAAAVHSGAVISCFTKEGIRRDPFPNPLPDPSEIDINAFPDRKHYFVQLTEDGVLHNPPLTPEEASDWTRFIVREDPEVFTYEPAHIVPVL